MYVWTSGFVFDALQDMRSILSDATERLATKEGDMARLQKLYDDVEAEKHVLKSQVRNIKYKY